MRVLCLKSASILWVSYGKTTKLFLKRHGILLMHLFSSAYTATSAEAGRFVEVADFAVLMLLVLAEHPCEGEHDTLLTDGVFVPRAVTRFLAHIFVVETERAQQVLDVEVEDQALFHVHFPDSERSEIGTAGTVVTG